MNKRLKALRAALGLTGEEFGAKLGVKRNAISRLETGKNNITEQMLNLICLTFNVNEKWLTTGEGEMFNNYKDDYIFNIAKQYNLNPIDITLIQSFLDLTPEERQAVTKWISKIN